MLYGLILAAVVGASTSPAPASAPDLRACTVPVWGHSEAVLEAEDTVPDPPALRPAAGPRLPLPASPSTRHAAWAACHPQSGDLLLLCRRNE